MMTDTDWWNTFAAFHTYMFNPVASVNLFIPFQHDSPHLCFNRLQKI